MSAENTKVIVRVSGMQLMDDTEEDSIVENIMAGSCKKIGDLYYIKYEELQEGFTEKSDVLIKVKSGYMEILKKGLINVHMIISAGEIHQTSYTTPFGNLLFSIHGKKVVVQEDKEGVKVRAGYLMEVNGEYLSENDIHLEASYCRQV